MGLVKYIKVLFGIIATVYIFWFSQDPLNNLTFHNINLIFHEAGHVMFFWSGEFFSILSGSILQIFIPLAFVLYFFLKRLLYAASVISLWLAGSIFDIQVYIADAQKMNLELLGGGSVIHDWNYILNSLGLLSYTDTFAVLVYWIALTILTLGFIFSIYYSVQDVKRAKDIL